MSKLFTPIELRGVRLSNRIVVSPMCQYASKMGEMNDWHIMHLGQFAMGAAGLVLTEATHVSAIGRITPHCAGLWNDEQEEAMKRVVDFCYKYGVAGMGVQLAHAGRKASTNPPLKGMQPLTEEEGAWLTVAPSAVPYAPDWHVPQALDRAGMAQIKQEFVEAAGRAARAGHEVCELHCAHGYLLNEYFSPLANHRDDEYGGPVENRIRFPLEVFEAVRAVWPSDRPLGLRVSACDWVEGGTTVEDTIVLAGALREAGCDFIDVSSGGVDPRQKIELGPGYQVHLAAAVKAAVDMPVMAVGMIADPHQAEEIIAGGKADFVMLARGVMYDPRWAWHAAEALGVDIDYPSQYIRCQPSRWPQVFPNRQAAE